MAAYMRHLCTRKVLDASEYRELWQWSVTDIEAFWRELAEYAGVPWRKAPPSWRPVLVRANGAEGAHFFGGAQLNYVDLVRSHPPDAPAVISVDEAGGRTEWTFGELLDAVARAAEGLGSLGVSKGDRVAAVLPNGLAAIVGFLATVSLGAIWSSCAPEFGAPSMVDRFQQIEPKVLLIADGYAYGGRQFDLSHKLETLEEAMPRLATTVVVPGSWPREAQPSEQGATASPRGDARPAVGRAGGPARLAWSEMLDRPARLDPAAVDFEHPLWILYSSGTTGLPKAIVHGHGGIVLEHLKAIGLHCDLGAGDRFFWFTTTGWMMWNYLLGGLLTGSTIVCYDGSPVHPDPLTLFRLASELGITFFGTSASFIESCRRLGLSPRGELDLSSVHSVGSTGSPLPPEGFAWATEELGDDVLVGSVSGGTDVCTAFLANCPLLPVHAGELQCAGLGVAVKAFGPDGAPVIGQVGELVVTEPMVSMPVALFGDRDGSKLHDSYFAEYPGVWRHGDWVKETARGSFVVYGRSDATLNRGGVRMGTAEFYRVVEKIDGVSDSLVIDTSELGREGELLLLVVPAGEEGDEEELTGRLKRALREELSPRHVPDRVIPVRSLPRTLNGKKVEVPVRKVVLGVEPDLAVSRDSLADPAAFDEVLAALARAGFPREHA